MPVTTTFTALLNAGVRLQDAEELERAYAAEPDFLDGLEAVATIIALKQIPSAIPPAGEPWKKIYTCMTEEMQKGADADNAWRTAIDTLITDQMVAVAISSAVAVRHRAILEFEAQKGAKKRFKTKDYLKGLRQLGYTFRMNELDDSIEVNGERISDSLTAKIRCQMRDAGFLRTAEMEDAYIAQAYLKRYHPIKEYLMGLVWNGEDNIHRLSEHFTDAHAVFEVWLRKWMIGACAKVFEAEQNPMFVLDGAQGIGKSEFVRWLCPLKERFVEAALAPDDKDSDVRLITMWIWEVSELGATTRKSDYEALKAFLTKRTVTVRVPYGRYDIKKPACASFIGTVNNSSGVLSDPTGSRRFLMCQLTDIDWTYQQTLDIAQVWAEAMAAYIAHEDWRLTPDEARKAVEINELYEIEDIVEGILKKHFTIDPTEETWWMPTAEILKILENPYLGAMRGTTKSNAMMLAATMTRLKCKKRKSTNINGQRVWGYHGIRIKP